jgi:hypothetical protein
MPHTKLCTEQGLSQCTTIYHTAAPWYPWVCGSKETTVEEKLQMFTMHRVPDLQGLKFTSTAHTVSLSTDSLKPRGAGYITTVTKSVVMLISAAHRNLGLISPSLSQILQMLHSFFFP